MRHRPILLRSRVKKKEELGRSDGRGKTIDWYANGPLIGCRWMREVKAGEKAGRVRQENLDAKMYRSNGGKVGLEMFE